MASRKLSKYRAGRDANRTPVPSGAQAVGFGPARDRPVRGTGRRRTRQSTAGTGPILGVTITNPEKALWPNGGDGRPVTKREFAQYLAAAGEWMLPHIAGRPCSLVRCPDGIGGQRFFQRHAMPGLSSLVSLARVPGDRKPYVQVDRIEALAALAQIAAVELHPWNCAPQRPQVPGRLVFDLDPAPDVGLQNVIAAARELRERLEALGLECFLKTTGGKGLHVVTPCAQPRNATLDWSLVKSFAREVCARMAADSPRRYVINMARRARTGRIFLDYLRNDRSATAVAPLSPRARAGAPVSMPLTWAQARAGLEPAKFTIRTALALLQRSDAWDGYAEAARPLLPAIERLAGGGRRAAAAPRRARATGPRTVAERHPA
jgi:bifunctional non-homologous end joining protein LigD